MGENPLKLSDDVFERTKWVLVNSYQELAFYGKQHYSQVDFHFKTTACSNNIRFALSTLHLNAVEPWNPSPFTLVNYSGSAPS